MHKMPVEGYTHSHINGDLDGAHTLVPLLVVSSIHWECVCVCVCVCVWVWVEGGGGMEARESK